MRQRVHAYLAAQDLRPLRRRMLTKTVLVGGWAVASYAGLLLVTSLWLAVPLSVSLGLAIAGVGMSIQHDANHGAYPVDPRARRIFGWTLDLLGASSYIWRKQHNVNHHGYTNVVGADADIELGPLARLAPSQTLRWHHRWQVLYLWPIYSLVVVKWVLWSDWHDLIVGRTGNNPFSRPRGRELLWLILGKLAAAVLWLGIPLLFHPLEFVLPFALLTMLVAGFVLAVVFQLAHIVEETSFPALRGDPAVAITDRAQHQLATTADFAPRSLLLRWYLGGLNFQVEHHLFPAVCHLHYPAISGIVIDTCREYGVPHHSHGTLLEALASHARRLWRLGQPRPGSVEVSSAASSALSRPGSVEVRSAASSALSRPVNRRRPATGDPARS
jgi:linoleoyl-CoA desaturase